MPHGVKRRGGGGDRGGWVEIKTKLGNPFEKKKTVKPRRLQNEREGGGGDARRR